MCPNYAEFTHGRTMANYRRLFRRAIPLVDILPSQHVAGDDRRRAMARPAAAAVAK